jgi:hypothetical protein
MAFVMDDIQVISPGMPKLFLYRTNDANAVYEANDYFSTVPGLAAGDIIIVAGDLDGTPEGCFLVVTGAGVATTTDAQTNS